MTRNSFATQVTALNYPIEYAHELYDEIGNHPSLHRAALRIAHDCPQMFERIAKRAIVNNENFRRAEVEMYANAEK